MKQLTSAQIETLVKKFDAQRSNVHEYSPMTLVQEMMTQYGLSVVTLDAGSDYGNFEYNKFQIIPDDTDIMIHNIKHFRIASPDRRLLPDFGLGASPGARGELASVVSAKDSMHEEEIVLAYDLVLSYQHHYQIGSITDSSY